MTLENIYVLNLSKSIGKMTDCMYLATPLVKQKTMIVHNMDKDQLQGRNIFLPNSMFRFMKSYIQTVS